MEKTYPKPNISEIVSQYLCHSCGACYAVCESQSITFAETPGGYLFPKIDSRLCYQCGVCYGVCPGLNWGGSLAAGIPEDPFAGTILSTEIGCATDQAIYKNGQSGGIATALLAHLLETGKIKAAIVAIMQKGIPPRGKFLIARNTLDLPASQKSKYVPIPLLAAISQLKDIDGPVALVGLPCHMHGLQKLFDARGDLRSKVLFKIGLVCDRVMTNASIDFLGSKATSSIIKNLVFRDKQRPVYPGNPVVTVDGGKEVVLKASLRMAIKDFFTPLRCRLCFDKLNVFADVVLGDPHGIKNVDRRCGETLLISRTETGKKLLAAAIADSKIVIRPVAIQEVLSGQNIIQKRTEWAGYMKAQTELHGNLPAYPVNLLKGVGFPGRTKRYTDTLLLCIKLDEYVSRSELFKAARKWLIKRRTMAVLRFPFTRAIKLWCGVLNRLRKIKT